MSFRRNTLEKGTFLSHYIKSTCYLTHELYHLSYTVEVDFDHLAETVFVRVLYHKATLFPTYHTTCFGRKSPCTAHTLGVESYAPISKAKQLHNLFGILQGKLVFFPLFIYYLSNLLITLIWNHGYLFYTLSYNLMLCYLFCCLNCSSFGHLEVF